MISSRRTINCKVLFDLFVIVIAIVLVQPGALRGAGSKIVKPQPSVLLTDEQVRTLKSAGESLEANEAARAAALYESLLSQGVDSREVRMGLGRSYKMLGDTVRAAQQFAAADDFDTAKTETAGGQGMTLARQMDADAPRENDKPVKLARPVRPKSAEVSPAFQPLPVLSNLPEEMKKQIISLQADDFLAPPKQEYSSETLRQLRSGLNGRWMYQGGDYIRSRSPSGAGGTLARGAQPFWSADSRRVVFISGSGGANSICLLDVETLKTTEVFEAEPLKRNGRNVYFRRPALSPDGRFVSGLADHGGGFYELVIKNLETGKILRPMPSQSINAYAWDAKGRKIIFTTGDCGADPAGEKVCIGAWSLEASAIEWFSATAGRRGGVGGIAIGRSANSVPVLSPSGRYLLVYDIMSMTDSAVVIDLMAWQAWEIRPTDINGNAVSFEGAAWSPDEKKLLFVNDGDLWVMDADGGSAFPAARAHDAMPPLYWRN